MKIIERKFRKKMKAAEFQQIAPWFDRIGFQTRIGKKKKA